MKGIPERVGRGSWGVGLIMKTDLHANAKVVQPAVGLAFGRAIEITAGRRGSRCADGATVGRRGVKDVLGAEYLASWTRAGGGQCSAAGAVGSPRRKRSHGGTLRFAGEDEAGWRCLVHEVSIRMGKRHHRPGSVAAKKGLDEAHTAATAGSRQVLGGGGSTTAGVASGLTAARVSAFGTEQINSRARLTLSAGEQTIVTNAVEAFGQHVQEKAAQELVGRQDDGLEPAVARGSALGTIVLAAEGHAPYVERDQAAVGDRRPMGEARQVGQHRNRRQRAVVARDLEEEVRREQVGDLVRVPAAGLQQLAGVCRVRCAILFGSSASG